MRQVSNSFKEAIKKYGRQIDVVITYTENEIEKTLDTDNIFSVTPIVSGNLLKSVMKQLNFESSEKIEKDTWINVQFGVLSDLEVFEYVDLGDYLIAEEPEYNADTLSYSYKCFDKMIYSMKDYESLNITYPITIKNYLNALANKIGLTLKESEFYNQNRQIQSELYEGLGYKYRDVLDEIAQATGSIICIDSNNELEVRYLNETNETIDEDLLKDINVSFGEKYGAINTIVLSRSAGTDNIYYPEVLPENPVEIKIQDNQIMNWNDRADYLPELYQALNGIEYYLNDFKSTGIVYLEIGDVYSVQIGENTYKCVLLNDEIDITQGLQEQIYTDRPEQSETDYSKADKTDMKINQTNLIVDKQNQTIEGIISQIGDRSQKTTTITADIDGIESKVQDLEDLTRTVKGIKTVTITDAFENENILELHIYGNNTVFDYLYPSDDLFPDDSLYPYGDSRIRFYNNNEDRTIELGIDEVLRANTEVKDEFRIIGTEVDLIRRVNADGTTKANEEVTHMGNLSFVLIEGNNTFEIVNYNAEIEVKYVTKSDYTNIFATKVEMNSSITQTAQEINLRVEEKLDEEDFTGANIVLAINNDTSSAEISADKISLERKRNKLN